MIDEEERLIRILHLTTRNLLSDFSSKAEDLKYCDKDIKKLVNDGINYKLAFEASKQFFKNDKCTFLAIDGTQSQDEELNLIVFYSGAFGYKGQIQFNNDGISYTKNLKTLIQ